MTTTERPTVEELYVTADGGTRVIAAAGMAAANSDEKERVRLALLLWSVTYQGKTEHKRDLADKLGMHLNKRMVRDRRLKGDAWKIAKEMLAWELHGVCKACDGRGYEVIKGTPSLSDNICHHCQGTGKRPYPREAAHVWLAAELGALTALASGEVMKRLAKNMDIW